MDALQTSVELQYGTDLLRDGRYYPQERINQLEAALVDKQQQELKEIRQWSAMIR